MSESGCRFQEPETPNPNYQALFEVLYAISDTDEIPGMVMVDKILRPFYLGVEGFHFKNRKSRTT